MVVHCEAFLEGNETVLVELENDACPSRVGNFPSRIGQQRRKLALIYAGGSHFNEERLSW